MSTARFTKLWSRTVKYRSTKEQKNNHRGRQISAQRLREYSYVVVCRRRKSPLVRSKVIIKDYERPTVEKVHFTTSERENQRATESTKWNAHSSLFFFICRRNILRLLHEWFQRTENLKDLNFRHLSRIYSLLKMKNNHHREIRYRNYE